MEEVMRLYFEALVAAWQAQCQHLPMEPFDDDIDPILYVGEQDKEGWICWAPRPKTIKHDLTPLEDRIGVKFPPEIHTYLNSYWFLSLAGGAKGYRLSLYPVAPGRERDAFTGAVLAYHHFQPGPRVDIPIGGEENGLLVVMRLSDRAIQLRDPERGILTTLAPSLQELIRGFVRGGG